MSGAVKYGGMLLLVYNQLHYKCAGLITFEEAFETPKLFQGG